MDYQKKLTEGVINRVYKYKMRVKPAQAAALDEALWTQRYLYNRALAYRTGQYKEHGVNVSLGDLKKRFITRAKSDAPGADGSLFNPWVAAVSTRISAETLTRLNLAFKAFFRRCQAGETPGYPKFKRAAEWNTLAFDAYTGEDGCKVQGNLLKITGVGQFRFMLYRPIPAGATIRKLCVTRQADGYFLCLTLEIPFTPPAPSENPPVGIDLGVKKFLVDSEGRQVTMEKFFRRAAPQLERLAREISRKRMGRKAAGGQPAVRGSKRWRRAKARLARAMLGVKNQRREWHRTVAKELAERHGMVVYERLQIMNMVRRPEAKADEENEGKFLPNGAAAKGGLNKSILDAAWGLFVLALKSACEKSGSRIVGVNPKNTTQMCSGCGCLPAVKIGLDVRMYRCGSCGLVMDRDHNAAVNILALGLASGRE